MFPHLFGANFGVSFMHSLDKSMSLDHPGMFWGGNWVDKEVK